MNRYVLIALMWPAAAVAQSGTGGLQGAWKVAEVTVTGEGAYTNSSPQAGLLLFTRNHYSNMTVNGRGPRPAVEPAKDPAHLTDAEKLARYEQWNVFTANAGTYETRGDTLSYRPVVAKNESVMAGVTTRIRFKLDGNTLLFFSPRANGGGETRTKLMRVE